MLIVPLTGLYNRLKLEELFMYEQNQSARNQHNVSVVLMDLDDFKAINDIYGHNTGDIVLTEIAMICQH